MRSFILAEKTQPPHSLYPKQYAGNCPHRVLLGILVRIRLHEQYVWGFKKLDQWLGQLGFRPQEPSVTCRIGQQRGADDWGSSEIAMLLNPPYKDATVKRYYHEMRQLCSRMVSLFSLQAKIQFDVINGYSKECSIWIVISTDFVHVGLFFMSISQFYRQNRVFTYKLTNLFILIDIWIILFLLNISGQFCSWDSSICLLFYIFCIQSNAF